MSRKSKTKFRSPAPFQKNTRTWWDGLNKTEGAFSPSQSYELPSWLMQAALTKYRRPGGLNNRHLFLPVLEAGRSKIKAPWLSAQWEPASWLAGFQLPFHGDLIQWGESSGLSPPFLSLACGPHTHDLIQTQLPPKDPISKLGDFNIWVCETQIQSRTIALNTFVSVI